MLTLGGYLMPLQVAMASRCFCCENNWMWRIKHVVKGLEETVMCVSLIGKHAPDTELNQKLLSTVCGIMLFKLVSSQRESFLALWMEDERQCVHHMWLQPAASRGVQQQTLKLEGFDLSGIETQRQQSLFIAFFPKTFFRTYLNSLYSLKWYKILCVSLCVHVLYVFTYSPARGRMCLKQLFSTTWDLESTITEFKCVFILILWGSAKWPDSFLGHLTKVSLSYDITWITTLPRVLVLIWWLFVSLLL